jgi:hypothetical protein
MTNALRIVYFFEDLAHEQFIRGLIRRIAKEKGVKILEEVLNATRGSRIWIELEQFLRDIFNGILSVPDILVIVIDGNCSTAIKVRKAIQQKVAQAKINVPYLACAVPNPHIERWYLEDPKALRQILPGAEPNCPQYKCEQDRYKNALKNAIRKAGLEPSLGGAEYGNDIAQLLDFYTLSKRDNAFKLFVDEVKQAIIHN